MLSNWILYQLWQYSCAVMILFYCFINGRYPIRRPHGRYKDGSYRNFASTMQGGEYKINKFIEFNYLKNQKQMKLI